MSERVSCRVLVIQCSNLKRKTLSQTSTFLLDFEAVEVLVFLVLLVVVGADAPPLAFRLAETALLVVCAQRMQAPGWPFSIFETLDSISSKDSLKDRRFRSIFMTDPKTDFSMS